MYFVSVDPLTRPVNNPINTFLTNPNIIIYHDLFIKYLWISRILLVSIGLKLTEKEFTTPFNPVFFSYYYFPNLLKHYLNTVHNLLFQSFLLSTDIVL